MLAWLTPDEPEDVDYVCLRLRVPIQFRKMVFGAIGELAEVWNWEEQGDMTPEECAEAMSVAWSQITEGCEMIGSIQAFATDTLPAEYLPCDNTQYHRVDYPDLYAVLDNSLIVDADHFLTPNLYGRVIMGSGPLWTPGQRSGFTRHTLTTTEIPAHTHAIAKAYGNDTVLGFIGAVEALVITQTAETTSAAGGGGDHNNLQPFQVWNYGIRWRW